MVRKEITIGDNKYKTQKECEEDVRQKLQATGITESVLKKAPDMYEFLLLLCQRHPRQEDKLKNIIDFEIRSEPDAKGNALAINIINNDNTITEISWGKCVTRKSESSETKFSKALRECVQSQIDKYRNNLDKNDLKCFICESSLTIQRYDIDHVVHFKKLVEDFIQMHKIVIPDEYDKNSKFRPVFRSSDRDIADMFYAYHQEHAILRPLCSPCNLKREKYKK